MLWYCGCKFWREFYRVGDEWVGEVGCVGFCGLCVVLGGGL